MMSVYGINIPWMQKGVGVDSITPSGGFPIRGDIEIYPSGNDILMGQSGNRILVGYREHSIGEVWITGNAVATPMPSANSVYRISGLSRTGAAMVNYEMSASGELRYTGPFPIKCVVHASADTMTDGGGETHILGILINDNAYPNARRRTAASTTRITVDLVTTAILSSGDRVAVAIGSETAGQSSYVSSYNLVISE